MGSHSPRCPQPATCSEPASEPVPGEVTLPLEGAGHHELAGVPSHKVGAHSNTQLQVQVVIVPSRP